MKEWKPMAEGGEAASPPEAPKAEGGNRLALILSVGFGLSVLLMCGGLVFYGVYLGATAPPAAPEDRGAVINIYDVHGWLQQGAPPDPQYESLSAGPAFLGSQEWDYEYEPPDSDEQLSFVSSARYDESSRSEASSTFSTMKTMAGVGVRIGAPDMELVDVSEQLVWGDQTYLARMVNEGQTVGHVVVARREKTVLFATFGIVWFEDKAAVDEWMVPVLERAATYVPVPPPE